MQSTLTSQNNTSDTVKRAPQCWRCKSTLDHRVARGMLVRIFFFWLPMRRYFCYNCVRKRYVRDR